eukprot:TRINITY_DN16761_c0_g2_i1.p1 TRINITY_DN16761_c0_g2~~TRINITY_DN16761_c0_g2_i1.p1  ORF type:complete len:404 (+),score=78.76 TRINITY_DN16761_c0_g2_i1:88-1299(+)
MGSGASRKKDYEAQGEDKDGKGGLKKSATLADLQVQHEEAVAREEQRRREEAPPEVDLTGIENSGYICDIWAFTEDVLSDPTRQTVLVRLVQNKRSGVFRAVKQHSLRVQGLNPQIVKRQVQLAYDVRAHPNIVRLYESFMDKLNIYQVMEHCEGGKLTQKILESEGFTEQETANVVQQLLLAVEYMHSRLIVHRDIKPDHVLLKRRALMFECVVKVCDFSQAVEIARPGQEMTQKVGTPYYSSPQVFEGCYTEALDVWSCGIVFYLLMLGYPNYRRAKRKGLRGKELMNYLQIGKFEYNAEDLQTMSAGAADLLSKMLKDTEDARCSPTWAVHNDWLVDQAPQSLGTRVQVASRQAVGLPCMKETTFCEFVKTNQNRVIIDKGELALELSGPKLIGSGPVII